MSEINHPVRVAPFIIVPRDDLDEITRELDTGFSIEDGREFAADEVLRNNILISIAKNALQGALRSFLHLCAHFLVSASFCKFSSEINNGNISGRYTEGHTSEFAIKFRNDFTDSLGSTSGRRNDVSRGSSSGSPVLATLGRSINSKLVNGHSVNGGHEAFMDTPVIVHDLSNGSQTVGGA